MSIKGRISIRFCFAFMWLFICSNFVNAEPIISSVSGQINDNQAISIKGAGFGDKGPTIVVFDDFNDGTGDGDDANLSATVGSWDGTGTYKPRYSSLSRSGNFSVEFSKFSSGYNAFVHCQFYKDFQPTTEYFLSYAVMIPENTYFPQQYATAPIGDFPGESVWKFAWIRDYENDPDSSPDDDDKCLPTHTSYGLIRTDGNDLNKSRGSSSIRIHENGDTWWQWGSWNRFAFWGKADKANPSTVVGREWAQGVSDGVAQVFKVDTTDPIFGSGTAPYQWTRLHINGWIRPTPSERPIKLLYDDIYFAVGPNSAARVEVGNAKNYEACTKISIATPTNWSDSTVSATIRQGGFNQGEEVYIFIVDAENSYSTGFGPFSFNSVSVSPPQDFRGE